MSSNSSISLSGPAGAKLAGVAIPVCIIPSILLFFRFYVRSDKGKRQTIYVFLDWLVFIEVPFFISVLTILAIVFGSELPTSIDFLSTFETKLCAAISEVGSVVLFVLCRCHFLAMFCILAPGGLKKRYLVLSVVLLGSIAITFDILQWVFRSLNEHAKAIHAFALVHSCIRLVTPVFILGVMLWTRPWSKIKSAKTRHVTALKLLAASGVPTLILIPFRVYYDAKHQEAEINAGTVSVRILEAFVDVFLLWHPSFTFRRRKDSESNADTFSTNPPLSPGDTISLSPSAETQYGSTTNIFMCEEGVD